MKTKIWAFMILFTFCGEIYAERCGCGSMAGGTTIEYNVITTEGQSNCCRPGAVTSALPALKMTWRSNRNGTYTMTSATEYEDYNQAQRDCCPEGNA